MNGVLVADKPLGPTSHDVVARVRQTLGLRRIGHTGTLDPLATGVLPLVVGQATRLASLLSASVKEYAADIRFGASTPTYDADARFLASSGRQSFASLRSGRPIPLPPPSKEWERDPSDRADDTNRTRVSFVGAPATIAPQIEQFITRTNADELIVVSHIYDHAARLRSYELASRL